MMEGSGQRRLELFGDRWSASAMFGFSAASGRSRTLPSVTTPAQPSARWMFACTSPHCAPCPRGSSRSWTTTMRGAGIDST